MRLRSKQTLITGQDELLIETSTKKGGIKWKNPPAPPNKPYEPTLVEHAANILTHGLNLGPVLFMVHNMMSVDHVDEAKSFTAIVYSCVLIGLFTVSTVFHSLACLCEFRSPDPVNGDCLSLSRELFHRGDRAMIYVFIAGSYTPWLYLKTYSPAYWVEQLRWIIWVLALMGIIYQQIFHERYKRLETCFYVLIGLTPAVAVFAMTDTAGVDELRLGGAAYLFGVIFFKLDGRLPFAHAIWHLFVVIGTAIHYHAVITYLL